MAEASIPIPIPAEVSIMSSEESSECERCDRASWASYFSYGWLNQLVQTGVQRQVGLKDTPLLASTEDTVSNARKLLNFLGQEERQRNNHSLLRAAVRTFWPELLIMQALNVISFLLSLAGPLVLQRVLIFQEAQNSGRRLEPGVASAGFAAVGGLVCLGVLGMFFGSQVAFFQARLTIRMSGALRGAVLVRGVEGHLKPAGSSSDSKAGGDATVYNVISFDVVQSIDILWVLMEVWLFPFQLVTVLLALFSQVAWSFMPGLVAIILVKAVIFVLLYWDGIYRDRLFAAKDERLSRCSEGFTNIRTLQMLAWTPNFQSRIMAARTEELRLQWCRLWFQKMPAALDYSLGPLVTLITLGYYVTATGAELKASLAIPVIGLISALIGPLGKFPTWMNVYLVWSSAYERVNHFMGLGMGLSVGGLPSSTAGTSSSGAVSLQGCTFSWGATGSAEVDADDRVPSIRQPLLANEHGGYGAAGASTARPAGFQLRNVSLELQTGDVLVVTGKEGQGKSSLLLALLGEMPLQAGSRSGSREATGSFSTQLPEDVAAARQQLTAIAFVGEGEAAVGAPAAQASFASSRAVPFASQEASLFAGTIRSNVLFGCRHEMQIYATVLQACALELDLASMAAGDLTEIAAGGSTISGGQRARIGLARAVYAAAMALDERPSHPPLVLLDDPFSALDKAVAREVCRDLFSLDTGLLRRCMVVVTAADPWWLSCLPSPSSSSQTGRLRAMVVRSGLVVAQGTVEELQSRGDLPELRSLSLPAVADASTLPPVPARPQRNPQDEEDEFEEQDDDQLENTAQTGTGGTAKPKSAAEAHTQTPLTDEQQKKGSVVCIEAREEGHVKCSTYLTYLGAVTYSRFAVMFVCLVGIMVFQNFCTLWIVYWTSDDKHDTFVYKWLQRWQEAPPEQPNQLLVIYSFLVLGFLVSNIAGHAMEIVGGIRASKKIFADALDGTLARPFKWWDTNPPGRVLNRFSEDVQIMDLAVTNIFGVIIGAMLYFLGHTLVLTLSSPLSLCLLPAVGLCMEYFARFYRSTIREIQRVYLVSMSAVYQEMVEAVLGGVTIRAYGSTQQVLSRCLLNLETLQRASFTKTSLGLWVGLRMGMAGFALSTFNQLYPVLQYYGVLSPQSAALVGFSIDYSSELVGIIQQFVMNFSDMEMQLISVERLGEYAAVEKKCQQQHAPVSSQLQDRSEEQPGGGSRCGLKLTDVEVTYREGLLPSLAAVSVEFLFGEVTAVMGRTGAGKTSLLLAIMQLVPYKGSMQLDGQVLGGLAPEVTRKRLVAIVPQQPVLFSGSLRWNLDPDRDYDDSKLWQALSAVGLQAAFGESGLDAQLAAAGGSGVFAALLSQGQRQLLCAARALLRQPRVALLDEVTASLPQELAGSTARCLTRRFVEAGAAVLLVTHQEELVFTSGICDRVLSIAGGRIVGDRRLSSGAAQ
ncbi:unnamed protein product [Polarella glacialis]|uniref:Uncharacterized protein n=1 Tax=Polarella glacialis TaxID=89957 RepID=A0A813JYN7_POLGL|nr:unnamed protein product [Polarella glacialis]